MKILSPVQMVALNYLIWLNKPSTSKELRVKITTMQSLQKAGYVKPVEQFRSDETFGLERKAIYWRLVEVGNDNKLTQPVTVNCINCSKPGTSLYSHKDTHNCFDCLSLCQTN